MKRCWDLQVINFVTKMYLKKKWFSLLTLNILYFFFQRIRISALLEVFAGASRKPYSELDGAISDSLVSQVSVSSIISKAAELSMSSIAVQLFL